MKAILEFVLPEEKEEFEMATNGSKLDSAVYEFDNWLRSKIKYGDLSDAEMVIYEEVRRKLWEFKGNE